MTSAPLGREWLAANLPHQGSMSLLDEIVAWIGPDLGATQVVVGDLNDASDGRVGSALTDAGFKVTVTNQDTDVQTFDGVVISQDPPGNTQQDPNTVITLFVGVFVPTTSTPTTPSTP